MINDGNKNFNWIFISLQWFLAVELCRYLCYSGHPFLIPLYTVSDIRTFIRRDVYQFPYDRTANPGGIHPPIFDLHPHPIILTLAKKAIKKFWRK